MKVIIIGKGNGWEDAPMDGETWGVNGLILNRSVKLAFQMHDLDEIYRNFREEIDKVNELDIPVITREKHKLLPTAIPFPLDKMPIKYFTSSIAYMIAYAIYKKATEIEMYGVAMLLKDEYSHQQSCVEFWIGCAVTRGIKVTIHEPTAIECFKNLPLYGYTTGI